MKYMFCVSLYQSLPSHLIHHLLLWFWPSSAVHICDLACPCLCCLCIAGPLPVVWPRFWITSLSCLPRLIKPSSTCTCILIRSLTEYFAQTMDAAGAREWHNAKLSMPAFDSIQFPQFMFTGSPAPFDGTEFAPDGFLLRWQFFWLQFMLSRLTECAFGQKSWSPWETQA